MKTYKIEVIERIFGQMVEALITVIFDESLVVLHSVVEGDGPYHSGDPDVAVPNLEFKTTGFADARAFLALFPSMNHDTWFEDCIAQLQAAGFTEAK